jgi:hypothetical protein
MKKHAVDRVKRLACNLCAVNRMLYVLCDSLDNMHIAMHIRTFVCPICTFDSETTDNFQRAIDVIKMASYDRSSSKVAVAADAPSCLEPLVCKRCTAEGHRVLLYIGFPTTLPTKMAEACR